MINPWLKWEVQDSVILSRDFPFHVKSHNTFRYSNPKTTPNKCFHWKLAHEKVWISSVVSITYNSVNSIIHWVIQINLFNTFINNRHIPHPFYNINLVIKWKPNFFPFTHEKGLGAITMKTTNTFCSFSKRKQEKKIK